MSKTYLEPIELERLEAAARYERDRLLIRYLRCSACRITEALGLEVKDVDFDAGTVTIQRLKQRLGLACPKCGARLGKKHAFCSGCGLEVREAVAKKLEHRRIRTIPLDQQTLAFLKAYIKRGGPEEKNGKLLIFPISRHRAWQIIRDCAQRAGLPKLVNSETGMEHNISPHTLRDSFAVAAMKIDDSGEGRRFLQEHLGHSSFDTTARYRKIDGHEMKSWYDTLWRQKDKENGD